MTHNMSKIKQNEQTKFQLNIVTTNTMVHQPKHTTQQSKANRQK